VVEVGQLGAKGGGHVLEQLLLAFDVGELGGQDGALSAGVEWSVALSDRR
jgi:hypothetical protein